MTPAPILTLQQIDAAREAYRSAVDCIRLEDYSTYPRHEAMLVSDLFAHCPCPVHNKRVRQRALVWAFDRWARRYGTTAAALGIY